MHHRLHLDARIGLEEVSRAEVTQAILLSHGLHYTQVSYHSSRATLHLSTRTRIIISHEITPCSISSVLSGSPRQASQQTNQSVEQSSTSSTSTPVELTPLHHSPEPAPLPACRATNISQVAEISTWLAGLDGAAIGGCRLRFNLVFSLFSPDSLLVYFASLSHQSTSGLGFPRGGRYRSLWWIEEFAQIPNWRSARRNYQ